MANVLARKDNKEYTIVDTSGAAYAALGYDVYALDGATKLYEAKVFDADALRAELDAYALINPAKTVCRVATASKAAVKAVSDVNDTLTIISTAALGSVSNALKVLLTTAGDDVLAVTKTDGTKTINIALAKTTAANNTAANIQVALRALSTVGGVDVSAFLCIPGGAWDTAAKATGEAGAVSFSGGLASTAAIAGLTAPVKGAVPDRVIPATDFYDADVEWDPYPEGNVFAASTAYTATIVLTPKPGYTLDGVTLNFFTVAGAASVANPVNSGVITVVFAATGA